MRVYNYTIGANDKWDMRRLHPDVNFDWKKITGNSPRSGKTVGDTVPAAGQRARLAANHSMESMSRAPAR